jgi:hypothetical protein
MQLRRFSATCNGSNGTAALEQFRSEVNEPMPTALEEKQRLLARVALTPRHSQGGCSVHRCGDGGRRVPP